jgi:O-acetyl-ADP-ribose deacetylase (regulator of RNase III)
MPIIEVIKGDLLASSEKYIAQQCNCVTVRAHGLSQSIATKYPYANVYKLRVPINKSRNCAKTFDQPGTIKICSSNSEEVELPHIICMFAQFSPGKPGAYTYDSSVDDSKENRIKWFQSCLLEIEKLGLKRIAMPYFIGCGLAGGDWKVYQDLLEKSNVDIVLYQL